ncbi:MAG: hypothetical protein J6U08_05725 [Paludibacteraceae bacterium]|nr:hypothetical protein [Paludibacteraceae bacterium]
MELKLNKFLLSILSILTISVILYGCDKGITITMYHEINPGFLQRGKTDKDGKKQGTFYAQKPESFKIDTYKDNVLNGYFCHYDKDGNITEEGFYKDGMLDSLYLEYHPGFGLKSRCNYAMGKKHGIYYEYFPSHILKCEGNYVLGKKEGEFIEYDNLMNVVYRGAFHNDTLIGDEIQYYPNGIVKSIKSGKYKDIREFDSTGRIASYSIERNGELTRTEFPLRPIRGNGIINNTSLIVDEVYSNFYEGRNGKEPMWTGRSISLVDDVVNISFNGGYANGEEAILCKETHFQILNGELVEGEYAGIDNRPLDYYLFDVNKIRHVNPKDDFSGISSTTLPVAKDTTIRYGAYHITVHSQRERIPGTGFNPITIQYKGENLEMKELYDVTLFSYDGDHNGENELYIISSTKTFGLIQIFRVRA